ncbi:hypothetical protein BLNAU_2269 [Blattamonas nauphoetae]|uniref:Uncharacterized protein n=1 Tax=Blattamonas nauphoetae TaxID=2049346 RepID=A0ABQ9YGF1_9EUKA|nr:hypothetical protein BLNAU_2269 [Blattamonas nauphoetae]
MQTHSSIKIFQQGTTVLNHRTLQQTNYTISQLYDKIPSDRDLPYPFDGRKPLDILPQFVGTLTPNSILPLHLHCFREGAATLTTSDTGAFIIFNLSSPTSKLCSDVLIFMTSDRLFVDFFTRKGFHTIKLKKWASLEEREEVERNGVRSETHLAQFFSTQLQIPFVARKRAEAGTVEKLEKALRSGDVLACFSLSGLSAVNSMLTGALVSHVALVVRENVRDEKRGSLREEVFVFETTTNDYLDESGEKKDGFKKTPFKKWYSAYNSHKYLVSVLPLRSSLHSLFNSTAAIDWFHTHRTTFSFRTFPFVTIDTAAESLPTFLSPPSVDLLAVLVEKWKGEFVKSLFVEGISKRFEETQTKRCLDAGIQCSCSSYSECLTQANRLGINLWDIIAIPEDDNWLYENGESLVCASVVLRMLRAGGLFSEISLNTNEFSPRDVTMLNIFDSNEISTRFAEICGDEKDTERGYCQIMGKFEMDLPLFNTVEPYNHMNEKCRMRDPDWVPSPEGC